jgi:calcineurin-like phosphoesterase family protein
MRYSKEGVMDDIWFTADTHFQHKLLADKRGFASTEEMDEVLVQRWNERIKRTDRVYHLGDVALGNPVSAAILLKRLNGQIYLVKGNHDRVAEHKRVRDRFVWIKDYFGLKIGEQKIYLLHYAMRTWNCAYRGSWHLHGHSHGTLPEYPSSKTFDVGVDCWGLYPVSYNEVATKMATKHFESVDCHGGS